MGLRRRYGSHESDDKRLDEIEAFSLEIGAVQGGMLRELVAEVRRLLAVEAAARKLDAFLPHGFGEKCVTHYDPEVEGLHAALKREA